MSEHSISDPVSLTSPLCFCISSAVFEGINYRDVTVSGVTVNHGKIPDSEGYRLSFNNHGNHRGRPPWCGKLEAHAQRVVM